MLEKVAEALPVILGFASALTWKGGRCYDDAGEKGRGTKEWSDPPLQQGGGVGAALGC